MLLTDYLDDYFRKAGLAPSTEAKYRAILTRWLAFSTPESAPPPSPADLTIPAIESFIAAHIELAVSTRRVYFAALLGFAEFMEIRELAAISTTRLKQVVKPLLNGRRVRLFDYEATDIDKLIAAALKATEGPFGDDRRGRRACLIAHRTAALITTLADSGLRISEALALCRGDIRWAARPPRAKVIGKGNKERWIFFSEQSAAAIKAYLLVRQADDAGTGRPLHTLALFANHHSKKAGLPISAVTGWQNIRQAASAVLPADRLHTIHPHSFRHHFLTTVWKRTKDLALSKELAGHANVSTTSRYTHVGVDDLAAGYRQVME